ncbi:MAG: hypothetical protein KGO02_03225 [Alphaproteobacteria bacterium]|nr:hypothetical protein [Alphaproteobacteria bacterium]
MTEHRDVAPLPLSRPYDLSDLGAAGAEIRISASGEELGRLAAWLEVPEVRDFTAQVRLHRRAADRFRYEAELEALVIQSCVVTLAPVPRTYRHVVRRVLEVRGGNRRRAADTDKSGTVTLALDEDDTHEELSSYRYDLALPLLEELSLGLDPYPRADGVEFTLPAGLDAPKDSPFAALAKLKGGK